MPKPIKKCTQCGARLKTINANGMYVCDYCGSEFEPNDEDTIATKSTATTVTEENPDPVLDTLGDIFSTSSKTQTDQTDTSHTSKEPKLRIGLLIFLFCLGVAPGFIYLAFYIFLKITWQISSRR